MMNNIMLVGRVAKKNELKNDNQGKEYTTLTIAVNRSYKNEEGIYETDFINVLLYENIARNAIEYLMTGDIVGIKGRVENNKEDKNGNYNVIADKLTFLSSRKVDGE